METERINLSEQLHGGTGTETEGIKTWFNMYYEYCIENGIKLHLYQNDFNANAMSRFLESLVVIADHESLKDPDTIDHENLLVHRISRIANPDGLEEIDRHNSHHKFTAFVQTLKQPYRED